MTSASHSSSAFRIPARGSAAVVGTRARWKRSSGFAFVWFLLLAPSVPLTAADTDAAVLEYRLKAGFLFNFLNFVQWPAALRLAPEDFYVVGVAAPESLVALFASSLEPTTANGRGIRVRHVLRGETARECHMLFISRAEKERFGEVLQDLGGAPVLTVGEFDRFGQQGGMINLLTKDGNVRLEINLHAAENAGLKISSTMANLATLVATDPRAVRQSP